VDGDGIVIGIEHDDFEQAAGGIGADHQDPVATLPYDAERDRDRCPDLLVGDSVPPSALRNLHLDRLPCQALSLRNRPGPAARRLPRPRPGAERRAGRAAAPAGRRGHPKAALARESGVSRETLYQYLRENSGAERAG